MTKFAVQTNLMNNEQLEKVRAAVERYPHQWIDIIPFSRDITSEEEVSGTDYIPYGSTLLTNLALDLGWTGLYFDLSKMNYGHWLNNHPDMLNDTIMSAKEAVEFLDKQNKDGLWFTRPSHDLKEYSGAVLPAKEIKDMLESRTSSHPSSGTYYLDPNTPVILTSVKPIQAEWRWFICGGEIVSGSMYRAHGQLRKLREMDDEVIREAQSLADKWLPHECVVMDTCVVEGSDSVKVVEFNCINSSGFYDHDIPTIFDRLWKSTVKV